MTNEQVRYQAETSSPLIKVAGVLWLTAFMIVMAASAVWIGLAVMSGDYYTNGKAVRDAAEAGSGALSQLGSIEAVKDWVLPFTLLGIATFILGYAFAFGNIVRNVRIRGGTMALALPAIKRGEKYCATCEGTVSLPHERGS